MSPPCALRDPRRIPTPAAFAGAGGNGGQGAIIDPDYKTPYAIHATAGVEHAFSGNWISAPISPTKRANHAYRAIQYQAGFTLFSPLFAQDASDQRNNVPNITVFRTDNRSRYDALLIHLQGNVSRRFNVVANYTLSSAKPGAAFSANCSIT